MTLRVLDVPGHQPEPRLAGLAVRWVDDIFADPPQQPDPLIRGLLRKGEMCVIGAPRAIGKSLFGMNMAVLLARGHGQLAGTLDITRQARVLYAQGELDPYESYARWYRMTSQPGPPAGIAETYDRWRIRVVRRRSTTSGKDGSDGWQETDEHLDAVLDPRLEQTIADHQIDVLIIDPWAVYYSGAENSNDEVEEALARLRQLSLTHQLAIVVFHHIGKNRDAADPEDLWRGASRLADWASTRVTILPHYSEREAAELQLTRQDARRFCDVHLLRRGEPTPDFSMVINHRTGWWEPWQGPGRPATVTLTPLDVARACAQAGGWESLRKAAASLGHGLGKTTELVERALLEGLLDEAQGANNSRRIIPSASFLATTEDF